MALGKITSVSEILRRMGQPTRKNASLNSLAYEWYRQTGLTVFANRTHKLSDWSYVSWGKYGTYSGYQYGAYLNGGLRGRI